MKSTFFSVSLSMFLLATNMLSAVAEQIPFAFLYRYLPRDPIIVEAGAHLGEDSSWKSEIWPDGKIYAFEPVPENFKVLEKVSQEYSNITLYPIAIADKVGERLMYVAGGASSLLKPVKEFNDEYFFADLDNPIMVPCTTLDQWAKDTGNDHIDFLWFDLEGFELLALQASPEILKNTKLIYTEVNLQQFWHGSVMYHDLKKWLEEQGFIEVWRDFIPFWHGNVVFIKDDSNSNLLCQP